ncbi:uncharacterized protein LOC114726085 [Neltuma alba]|uniref:uncharacterized protein LOC114726085 n=1 Tax=Neltuma alba TaxID=207710 RepID=UPI0010A43A5C|nr:uncharacterized protein LOC114726085 [Prosopis alba]
MFIRGRNKEHYLTWDPKPPKPEDSRYATWCAEDNMVMTWLIHSMNTEISENYLLANFAREIWELAKRTFSAKDNTAALLQVKRMLRSLTQGEKMVTQYFSALIKLWQQLDLYEIYHWVCQSDGLNFRKIVEKERCFDFLLGLNVTFEDVRGCIMGMQPLPSLEDVFNMVRYEESRKELIYITFGSNATPFLPSFSPTLANEGSVMITRGNQDGDPKGKKSNLRCNHCNKNGHTRDTCWKMHRKPAHLKQRTIGDGKGLLTTNSDSGSQTMDELTVLRQILDKYSGEKNSEKPTPSVTLAHSGPNFGEDDWQS